ncbi:MAG: peroxiredoxin-like family protein [Phormidesmis sp.]
MNTYSLLSQAQLIRVSDGQLTALFDNCPSAKRRLILLWPQLGDFDALEYAWWVGRDRLKLAAAHVEVRAVGIGDRAAGQKFCAYTGFSPEQLFVDSTASLHQELGLYKGLTASLPGFSAQQNGYLSLLLMCAGIGSPGTLTEVLRGYKGDKSAPQLIGDDEVVKAAPLPPLKGEVFKRAGGKGFQRPFELATLRLRNMAEVLGNWKTYVPDATYLTQRGGTFLFEPDGEGAQKLVYEWRDRNILGFAKDMSDPLSFLHKLFEQHLNSPN